MIPANLKTRHRQPPWLPLWVAMACFILAHGSARGATSLDFNRDIRPILSENCYACHGADPGSREGGLRLDERAAALRGGKTGLAAIVPGKPEESEILLRMRSAHDDEAMPPPDRKDRLSAEKIALVEQWIREGAIYLPHWAFIAPHRPALPRAQHPNGKTVHPIDALVGSALAAEKLTFAPEAAPAALGRRIYLDITGLPPPPAEIDAFVSAYAQDGEPALSSLVDRLLSSPHYGEKWARHWLDVARYADSDGYEKDLPREQWAWRDWVIRALNEDKPYDRFIIEQIAGDLLVTPATSLAAAQDLRVATGYLRNSMVNEEGAIKAEEFRLEGMFDRMDALGKGVLGVTLQCAQCHTHKYDPITHHDYFRTLASIDNTYEAISAIYRPEKLRIIERIEAGIAAGEAQAKTTVPDWAERLAAWSDALRVESGGWSILRPTTAKWIGGVTHPEVLPDGSVLTRGFRPPEGELVFEGQPALAEVAGLRLEALTHGDLIFGGPGRSKDGLFAVSELTVEVMPPGERVWRKLELTAATADFDSPQRPLPEFFHKGKNDQRVLGGAAFLIDGKEETAWSPDRGLGRRNAPTEVVVQFRERLTFPEGTAVRGTLRFNHGGDDGHGRTNHLLGRFRVALTTAPQPAASRVATAARLAAETEIGQRSAAGRAALFAAWLSNQPDLVSAHKAAELQWRDFPERDTTVLHLAERTPEDSRKTFRLDRGAWDQPRDPVAPGLPEFLGVTPMGDRPARLAFALALTDPKSPTAARVAVNRVWQAIFGSGLVEAPEDFGVRSTVPKHGDLLDWLAVDFMERGWSQKQLIRRIVLSRTYRQASHATPELRERDPGNRLLARGPRLRVEAEVVRDIALSVSGLLNDRVGGASIYPPVPESLFATSFVPVTFWEVATGAERYRRSLYVFRRRSMPDPLLSSFDAPNGDVACAARPRSNTPLAALAALNETVFVEAAQSLALRLLREGGASDDERIALGFRLCASRLPRQEEIAVLSGLLRKARIQVAQGWLSAREFAFGSDGKAPPLPLLTNPADAAAWTAVARVLLNLDETLTKL